MDMSDVAKNLKCLRKQAAMTQEELAERLHVTRQVVSSWETGKTQPDIETLTALAEILGTDVNELICGPRPRAGVYLRFQRRYVVLTSVCGAVLLMKLLLGLTFEPWMLERQAATFDIRQSLYYGMTVPPLAWLAAGVGLPALTSLWADLRVRDNSLRRGLAVAGGLCLLLYGGWFLSWWAGIPDWPGTALCRQWFYLLLKEKTLRQGSVFLGGLLLFGGLNGESTCGEDRKSGIL